MDKITKNTQLLYDEIQFGSLYRSRKRENYYPLLDDVLSSVRNDHVLLDAGCGTGFWINTYLNKGMKKTQILGIDLSYKSLVQVKQQKINAVCADVKNVPLKDESVEVIICNGLLQHVVNPQAVLAELLRVAKKQGTIYFNAYNVNNPYYYLVHRAAAPLRYLYWHWNKKIAEFFFPLFRILFLPLARIALGEWLDLKATRTIYMDQVLVPKAHLFSRAYFIKKAKQLNCRLKVLRYIKYGLVIEGILEKQL